MALQYWACMPLTVPASFSVMQLTSLAWDLHDGLELPAGTRLSRHAAQCRLTRLPSALEYWGYLMFPVSIVVGPGHEAVYYLNTCNNPVGGEGCGEEEERGREGRERNGQLLFPVLTGLWWRPALNTGETPVALAHVSGPLLRECAPVPVLLRAATLARRVPSDRRVRRAAAALPVGQEQKERRGAGGREGVMRWLSRPKLTPRVNCPSLPPASYWPVGPVSSTCTCSRGPRASATTAAGP